MEITNINNMTKRQQVIRYLSCNDLEMVNLGVIIMKEYIPRKQWQELLEQCSKEEDTEIEWQGFKYPMIGALRYRYRIQHNDVLIMAPYSEGIWTQIKSEGYKHTYDIKSFSMNTLQQGINSFLTQSKNHSSKGKQTYNLKTYKIKHK